MTTPKERINMIREYLKVRGACIAFNAYSHVWYIYNAPGSDGFEQHFDTLAEMYQTIEQYNKGVQYEK